MTYFLLYIILLWFVNAWHDADYYNKKNAHISGAVLALLIFISLFILKDVKLYWVSDYINLFFLTFSLRWIIFDISYNLLIGKKWYYKGNTAFLDRIFSNVIHFSIKLLMLFIDIPIIISLYNN